MTRTITIRNVPDEVADELSARARESGRSLQGLVLALLRREAATPDIESVMRQVRVQARDDGVVVDNEELLTLMDEERLS